MAPESLVGFGVVALAVCLTTSLLLTAMQAVLSRWPARQSALTERRMATLVLTLPPVLGFGVAALIAVEKGLAWLEGSDHCLGHGHHLHLCPIHGDAWTSVPWVVAVVAAAGTYVLARDAQVVWAHASAHALVRRLKRSGRVLSEAPVATLLVPSPERFAFTVGLVRSTVIVSSAAWEALGDAERIALLAHEAEHVARGDVRKRALLGVLAAFGVPGLAEATLGRWTRATERASDAAAARIVGRPSTVASALVALAHSDSRRPPLAAVASAAACDVEQRVVALFSGEGRAASAPSPVTWWILGLAAVALVATGLGAEALHHIFETLFG